MFKNLSIAKKLYLGFGLLLAILAVLVFSALMHFGRVSAAIKWTNHTYEVLLEDDKLLTALVNIETGMRGFVITGTDAFLEPVTGGQKEFDLAFTRIVDLTSDNKSQQDRLRDLGALKQAWMEQDVNTAIEFRRAVVRGEKPLSELIAIVTKAEGKAKFDKMRVLLAEIHDAESKLLSVRAKEVEDTERAMTITLIGGGIVSALIGMLIAWSISSSTSRRLTYAVDVANSAARGDFSVMVRVDSVDEIGLLLKAFGNMQQQLRELMSNVRQSAGKLLDGAGRISSTADQIAAGARDQSSAASSMAAAVEELTVSITHVADNARDAHRISTESGRVSNEGGTVIRETVQGIESIATSVRTASQSVADLGTQAAQISGIVGVIKEIADQTNLLALNAAIEAARAGESGRGFAVVADEVRKLAERTTASTKEISVMIDNIQSGTKSAVGDINRGVQQVEKGVVSATQAGTAIGQIQDGSSRIVQMVSDISQSLKEQSNVANNVAGNVERMASLSEENSRAADEAAQTARNLRDLATQLDGAVAQFKLK